MRALQINRTLSIVINMQIITISENNSHHNLIILSYQHFYELLSILSENNDSLSFKKSLSDRM